MNIGFIGTGNMGRILIDAFIESKAVHPSQLTITNRTKGKAKTIQKQHREIQLGDCAEEVVRSSQLIFICVKPLDIHPLLIKIKPLLTKEHCIVSITSPISVEQLESIVPTQVARIIPSITNRALSGVSLMTYGDHCSSFYQNYLTNLFSSMSKTVSIPQNITRVSSDIVSCGPAFFSFLLQKFIDAAVQETEISKEEATIMASDMIIGMGKLLEKEIFTLPTLQEKVCVKGGVTGEGIKVLEEELGDMFVHLFQKTHEKFDEDIELVEKQFNFT
ncbi:late competence protein ComER [Priestia flexa]|uniref:Pyrroline-5-carboxylate reductase n=1 Tax=Priestia flexa TaxID=86664 RepID=A0A1N6SS35_9BACI|nr:late competence protein ComER [Priestia flexa]AQX53681.1 late competence protein ComER [Priestia flexa]MBN8250480.1 late competence protein ComER [Priestia flexa]MBY6085195.1 late competence protein ComER [Priestia flexa]MCA1200717.1 late competence protein ComER [Priestia flexa]MCG7311799.1 late competence protein ComER [Priestia flexa]